MAFCHTSFAQLENSNQTQISSHFTTSYIPKFSTQRYFQEHVIPQREGGIYTGSGANIPPGWPREIGEKKERIDKEVKDRIRSHQPSAQKIKIVFHMLHNMDEIETTSMTLKQIIALNRDFNGLEIEKSHPNDPEGKYMSRATSPQLTFESNIISDRGVEVPGIVSHQRTSKKWSEYDAMKDPEKGGAAPKEPDRYLNIWVCHLDDEISSYATSPYQSDDLSGIVIDYRLFGQKDSLQGKALTHLIGNYLGLEDLYNEYEPCKDDGVDDTIISNAPNFGKPRHRHRTTCASENMATEMVMNFMDSTDDEIQVMFTKGQVARMHAFLHVARSGLLSHDQNSNQ